MSTYLGCHREYKLQNNKKYKLINQVRDPQKQASKVFYENGVLEGFAKFTGKYLCQSLLFNKVVGLNFKEHLFFYRPPSDYFWFLSKFRL